MKIIVEPSLGAIAAGVAVAGSGVALVGALLESIPVAVAAAVVSGAAVALKKYQQSENERLHPTHTPQKLAR